MAGDSTSTYTERAVKVIDKALNKFEIAVLGSRMDMNRSFDTLEEEIRQSGRRTRLRLVLLSASLTVWMVILTVYF